MTLGLGAGPLLLGPRGRAPGPSSSSRGCGRRAPSHLVSPGECVCAPTSRFCEDTSPVGPPPPSLVTCTKTSPPDRVPPTGRGSGLQQVGLGANAALEEGKRQWGQELAWRCPGCPPLLASGLRAEPRLSSALTQRAPQDVQQSSQVPWAAQTSCWGTRRPLGHMAPPGLGGCERHPRLPALAGGLPVLVSLL